MPPLGVALFLSHHCFPEDLALDMRLFARAKKAPSAEEAAIETQRAIARLNEHSQMTEKRIEFKQKEADSHRASAKRFMMMQTTSSRQKALAELKRARMIDAQLNQMYAQLEKITSVRDSLDGASFQHQTIKAMQTAAESMRNMNVQFTEASGGQDPSAVMEDITDQMNQAADISEALSKPLGSAMVFDEDELEAELAAMEQEVFDEHFNTIAASEPSRHQPVFVQTNHYYPASAASPSVSAAAQAAANAPTVPMHQPASHYSSPTHVSMAPQSQPSRTSAVGGIDEEELEQLKRMKQAMLAAN